jgi:hypothetical protein
MPSASLHVATLVSLADGDRDVRSGHHGGNRTSAAAPTSRGRRRPLRPVARRVRSPTPVARSSCSRRANESADGFSTRRSATASPSTSAAMGRLRPRPGSAARGRARHRDLPPARRRAEPARRSPASAALSRHDPAPRPARPLGHLPRPAPLRPPRAGGRLRGALGGGARRPARPRNPRRLVRAQRRHRGRPRADRPGRAHRLGTGPEELSMLHVLFYVASAGSFDKLIDTEGGAQQDRLDGGAQLLPPRPCRIARRSVAARLAGPPDLAGRRPASSSSPTASRSRRSGWSSPLHPRSRPGSSSTHCPRGARSSPSGCVPAR